MVQSWSTLPRMPPPLSSSRCIRKYSAPPHNIEEEHLSFLQKARLSAPHRLPDLLQSSCLRVTEEKLAAHESSQHQDEVIAKLFPKTWGQPHVSLTPKDRAALPADAATPGPLRVGIVLSGGQAAGGHNVIAGVFDYIKSLNCNSQLFGFRGGPSGIYEGRYKEITEQLMNQYRNLGGFDMLRSGRHKIETPEQKQACLKVVGKLDLHGIVVVGGDDSNTNAAVLAEYFREEDARTCVAGVPKTIDGDLRNEYVETSFGFDTAIRTYSEQIGNLMSDVATSRKYYHFVRLMGRSASNITLQCALLTRPNLTLIGEEVEAKKQSLKSIVDQVVELVLMRRDLNKNYGVILLPEGLIEFIPEFGVLIREINTVLAKPENQGATADTFDHNQLTPASSELLRSLPKEIQSQLLLDRDPHGNVMVSRIATERLLVLMTRDRLLKDTFNGDVCALEKVFLPQAHFFGYEGRAATPTLFDADYCYALGRCAAALIDNQRTGYMSVVRDLQKPYTAWRPGGCPLTAMMNIEVRKGKEVPVIKKYLVELEASPFTDFVAARDAWKTEDVYSSPGPVQFEGPCAEMKNFSIMPVTQQDLLPDKDFGSEANRTRHYCVKSFAQLSPLQRERLAATIPTPKVLFTTSADVGLVQQERYQFSDPQVETAVVGGYPMLCRHNKHIIFKVGLLSDTIGTGVQSTGDSPSAVLRLVSSRPASPGAADSATESAAHRDQWRRLRVGVLLNGQQAAGVANVIVGLWERLAMEAPVSSLIGFLGGSSGFLAKPSPKYVEISRDDLKLLRNQGGLELLGRENQSETLLVSKENVIEAARVCEELKLDGLVLIGGRYTLTNVAILSEDFLSRGMKTRVIGVPVTQNHNIDSSIIESSIGFDTASKVYSSLIGNLNTDGASAAKYWQFVRLMGSNKSQIAVEVALSTHPNATLVTELYGAADKTLNDIVCDVADTVMNRATQELLFGTVLIPEGLISALSQFRLLLSELHNAFSEAGAKGGEVAESLMLLVQKDREGAVEGKESLLSAWNLALLRTLPDYFVSRLLNPNTILTSEYTKIPTEELLADMVSAELKRRQGLGQCPKFSFAPLCCYLGYQGRSSLPSDFDCALGLAHGALAAVALKSRKLTGYVTVLRGLAAHPSEWIPALYPASVFLRPQCSTEDMNLYPPKLPIVPSDMVRLQGRAILKLLASQQRWEKEDRYANPGPIQFQGEVAWRTTETLNAEHKNYLDALSKVSPLNI